MTQRVVLVTGASRGIGAATARAFAAEGAHVVLAARDAGALHRVADAIAAAGGAATVHAADLTVEEEVDGLFARIAQEHGRLDAAADIAGGSGPRPAPLADWSAADFRATVDANLTATFLCLRRELPAIAASGGGAVVTMSSTAGLQGVAGLAGYVAAKHAVEGLTRVAALEGAAGGVRVNAVAPGPVLTERLAAAGPEAQRAVADAVPIGRLATPEEVAAAVVWLCSPASAFVTGTTLAVDGGRLAGSPAGRR